MKMERIKIFTGGDLSKVYIPEPNSVDDYLDKFALYSSTAKYVELTIEPGEKISSSVKMYLMDDIEYTDTTIFMDGEPSVARIFILESNNNIRFFTSEGSYGEFGDPTEHKKEDFLKLLDNHPHLNKNKVAAHLKSISQKFKKLK